MIEQVETKIVTITPAAEDKVRELLKQEDDPNLALRVFVAGGGCSGSQYGMTLDALDEKEEDDTVEAFDGFVVLIDAFSKRQLEGSEIDYVDSLMGAGFTVNNPQAISTCSCGHSFRTAEGGGEARSCGCGH